VRGVGAPLGLLVRPSGFRLNVMNIVDIPMTRTAEEAEWRYLRATPLAACGFNMTIQLFGM